MGPKLTQAERESLGDNWAVLYILAHGLLIQLCDPAGAVGGSLNEGFQRKPGVELICGGFGAGTGFAFKIQNCLLMRMF